MAKAGGKFSRNRHPRFRVGGKRVIFDPDSEYAIGGRLEEEAERLRQQLLYDSRQPRLLYDSGQSRRPVRKQQRKPAQEKILRKLREKYPPDGNVGDASVAEVRRTISGKGFEPTWDSVNRALGRASKK